LEVANLNELIMINSILVVVDVLITASLGHYIGTGFAMHDSTLDVNTWLASDNSTQLNTIDLNTGPMASAADSAGAAETGDDAVESEEGDEETDETDETVEDETETPTDDNGTDEDE